MAKKNYTRVAKVGDKVVSVGRYSAPTPQRAAIKAFRKLPGKPRKGTVSIRQTTRSGRPSLRQAKVYKVRRMAKPGGVTSFKTRWGEWEEPTSVYSAVRVAGAEAERGK
jgi:hypothetical protein